MEILNGKNEMLGRIRYLLLAGFLLLAGCGGKLPEVQFHSETNNTYGATSFNFNNDEKVDALSFYQNLDQDQIRQLYALLSREFFKKNRGDINGQSFDCDGYFNDFFSTKEIKKDRPILLFYFYEDKDCYEARFLLEGNGHRVVTFKKLDKPPIFHW